MPVNRGLRERSLRMSQWLKGSGAKGSLFKGTYPTAGLFECSVDSYLTGKFVLTEDLFVTHLKMIFKNVHRCRYFCCPKWSALFEGDYKSKFSSN